MRQKVAVIFLVLNIFVLCGFASELSSTTAVELARYEQEYSSARVEPARMGPKGGVAVIFEGSEDLHYYAKAETAPVAGFELKVEAKSEDFDFNEAVFPQWEIISDPLGKKVEVYAGRFFVFVPFKSVGAPAKRDVIDAGDVEVRISGQTCTSMVCLQPFEKTLRAKIDLSRQDLWSQISFEKAGEVVSASEWAAYSTLFALVLAFLAGLILNIMPCVLPVIPLKVLSIFEQAKESKRRCIALGLSFCLGILLLFTALAVLNIVLRLGYGRVFQWGDHFRSPSFLVAMSLLMVVLSMFCFGVFTISVPTAIAGRAGAGKGYFGSVGMGFLAAILSTPCSFATLTAAFAWAQTQNLAMASVVIIMIGVGMATPYAILTSMPSLLKHLPKPGRWMEIFKQAMGFMLLAVAVWLVTVLPEARKARVLNFAVVLAFCVWMWGGWVNISTRPVKRRIVRIAAVLIAFVVGWQFLAGPVGEPIDWQGYDADLVETALAEEQPVLIRFTAEWCLSCKTVEKTVYARDDIAELVKSKGVLAIKADTTTAGNPATVALEKVYNEPGVPVSIFFVPGRDEPARLHGVVIGDKLKRLLEELPEKD
ncbi:MAG: protein-disulfide reductase DsbD family protein [Planctomycetota bacterium]|jgi:thiol:disulfide interchange protein DsbD